jgi:hypothetical protein
LVKNGTNTVDKNTTFVRWFLSTDLMNDCYAVNSDNFIKDYGNPDSNEKNILDEKLKVKLTYDLNAVDNSNSKLSPAPTTGTWTKKVESLDEDIYVEYEHKYILDISVNPKAKIANELLYPDIIKVSSQDVGTVENTSVSFNEDSIEKTGTYDTLENFVIDNSTISSNKKKI